MDKIGNSKLKMSDKCDTCVYKSLNEKVPEVIRHFKPITTPCFYCADRFPKPSYYFNNADNISNANKNYDEHYNTSNHQSIEVMQANMTHEEFIGHLKGNIIKYALRMGRKDDVKKEAAKIRRYAQWLEQAVNGEIINPRKP